MARPQRQDDVHQDELCPSNKRYALIDANKNIDLDNPLYPNESKIMANIIQNHPLSFSITASSSVPWIYLGIFHLPQATDNNHERFVAAPKVSKMIPLFLNTFGFTLELRSPSNFKTTGLVQPWQRLGKIFARCLTTRVTGHDQPPLQIMQIARDKYHNLEDDVMVKNIFNSGKHKDNVGTNILSWMITDEMKLTDHYRMYVAVFRVDVPMNQSQPIESIQGTHRTTSAPRLQLRSNKESLKVEITAIEQPINFIEEEEESAEDDYELRRREKEKHSQADVTKRIADAIQQERKNLRVEISLKITNAITNHVPSQDDPYDDAPPEGENSVKMQKTFEHGTFEFEESPSDDDEIPTEKVSQELVDEMSHTVDAAKLHKVVDEMLRQRCTSVDQHQYHFDQMKKFLKNDIVWESMKKILVLPHPQDPLQLFKAAK
nr:hypothetical protein [Tanacetum cinerariifolium]